MARAPGCDPDAQSPDRSLPHRHRHRAVWHSVLCRQGLENGRDHPV